MFGGSKFGFGQNQQSSFGKPATFGQPGFGQQSTLFQQPTTSVFGQPAAPSFGAPAPTFGQTATTQSAFGCKQIIWIFFQCFKLSIASHLSFIVQNN